MSIQNIENPKITDFSYDIFGGILLYDGAGFYPGLELLNLIFLNSTDSFLPDTSSISFNRHSMDFARKLVWDDAFASHPQKDNILYDNVTKDTLAKLLECLQLDIPNASGRPAWHRAHFFPYTESLIHYDARKRRSTTDSDHQVEVERKYIRGAGALAFKVLRFDDNLNRKRSISAKLNKQRQELIFIITSEKSTVIMRDPIISFSYQKWKIVIMPTGHSNECSIMSWKHIILNWIKTDNQGQLIH